MSIKMKALEENLIFLSHEQYLKSIYKVADENKISSLFDLKTPFKMDAEAEAMANRMEDGNHKPRKKKKREPIPDNFRAEVDYLKSKLQLITSNYKEEIFPGWPEISHVRENNKSTRQIVHQLMKKLEHENQPSEDANETDDVVESKGFLLPPRSSYKTTDVRDLGLISKYDLVLLDPPWENKHVKRANKTTSTGYCMLDNQTIRSLQMNEMVGEGGVVAVWCSNNLRHRADVRDWFKSWGLEELGLWYWLKMTRFGEPICEFSAGKNPHEVLMIAYKPSKLANGNADVDETKTDTISFQKDLVIVSVPSGIHSHKPPISDVIDLFFKHNRKRLEIFGRYLQPDWTTVGMQPSKLNSVSLLKTKS